MKIPVGEQSGRLITDVTVAELEADLCSLTRHTHRERKLRAFVNAARPLLQRRKFPTGSYSTTEAANRALRDATEMGHLVAPSTQLARLLDGTALIVSALRVDMPLDTFPSDDDPKYRVPGKPMLDRIAGELGVSWRRSQRTDNQTNPHLRSCVIDGKVREFDGSKRDLEGHAEIDLSEGSSLQKAIVARFSERNRGRIELERRRQFILSHADTNARLRAIKQLGLRDKYTPTDLEKPFFVARTVFTGQSDDPQVKALFDGRIVDSYLPAADALFGAKKAAGQ